MSTTSNISVSIHSNDTKSIKPLPQSIHSTVSYFESAIQNNHELSITVAAIQSLIHIITISTSNTLMELQLELKLCADQLLNSSIHSTRYYNSIQSGCILLQRTVTKYANEIINNDSQQSSFAQLKSMLSNKLITYEQSILNARNMIAHTVTNTLFKHNTHNKQQHNILIHGYSRVVIQSLLYANKSNKKFRIYICNNSLQQSDSQSCYNILKQSNIDCILISANSIAYHMQSIDYILLGAESLTENGGCINSIGTLNITLIAQSYHKLVYVCCETYKFCRIYPLSQSDITANIDQYNPILDYTRPELINLLFTEIGILSPNSVSDELIKLYY